jgi:uncharacterized protein (TIGR00255 family)
MTGFAQVKAQVDDQLGIALSLKAVNHRFLDLHLRMPPDSEALEMKLRRRLKDKLARGHVELTLSLVRSGAAEFAVNTALVRGYVQAFRTAAHEAGLNSEPDLNLILKFPGVLEDSSGPDLGLKLESAVTAKLDEAIRQLNEMRAEEGRSIAREFRERLRCLQSTIQQLEGYRATVMQAYLERIQTRMQELIGSRADPDRILQEAALLAERSDIREEIVRMDTHIQHFTAMLDQEGEVGKKLDFLAQEMNREANTLLSKTSGLTGEALRITELGLAMKSEIEKIREQVQNVE